MIFAMVGSGEYLPAIEPLDRDLLARLPQSPRVVCLPTAAGLEGAARIDYWSQSGVAHFTRLGAVATAVPIIDRTSANDPVLAAQIAQANFVYLSGGKPDYLYRTLVDSLAWQAITAVTQQGGVLAGCSAGAMIMGEKYFGFPSWKDGFGLVPNVTIIPHFDEISDSFLAPVRLLTDKGLIMVGVDGNTALVQANGRYEVVGNGRVTIWRKGEKQKYAAGLLPDGALDG
jgi:cyanophycinase